MSQGYELLVAEVDRVVNSPYPTQLKVGYLHHHNRQARLTYTDV
jgi:hypothetical protein